MMKMGRKKKTALEKPIPNPDWKPSKNELKKASEIGDAEGWYGLIRTYSARRAMLLCDEHNISREPLPKDQQDPVKEKKRPKRKSIQAVDKLMEQRNEIDEHVYNIIRKNNLDLDSPTFQKDIIQFAQAKNLKWPIIKDSLERLKKAGRIPVAEESLTVACLDGKKRIFQRNGNVVEAGTVESSSILTKSELVGDSDPVPLDIEGDPDRKMNFLCKVTDLIVNMFKPATTPRNSLKFSVQKNTDPEVKSILTFKLTDDQLKELSKDLGGEKLVPGTPLVITIAIPQGSLITDWENTYGPVLTEDEEPLDTTKLHEADYGAIEEGEFRSATAIRGDGF